MGKLIIPILNLINGLKSGKVSRNKILAVLIAVGLTATGISIDIDQITQIVELMQE